MASTHIDRCDSFVDWKNKSKVELKKKIKSNLERRGAKLTEIVNKTIHGGFSGNNHRLYSANQLLSSSLNDIFTKVDEWSGVNIVAMNNAPETFDQYHKRSDNWWNRCKASWLGDYYFYPFLHQELHQFIENITNHCSEPAVNELLYFTILSNIINAEIHYHRSRPQPLILDKSFIKSKDLNHLFHGFGVRTCIPWQIPPKNSKNNGNYRIVVRQFAKRWAHSLLEEKKLRYNKHMATLKRNLAMRNTAVPSTEPKASANQCTVSKNDEIPQKYVHVASNSASNAFFSGPREQSTHKSTPAITTENHYRVQPHALCDPSAAAPAQPSNRYHPYKSNVQKGASPILSAQCQIRVYDTCNCTCGTNHFPNYRNTPLHHRFPGNNRVYKPCSGYAGVHSPSGRYISGNGQLPNRFITSNVTEDDELCSVCHGPYAENEDFSTV